MRTLTRSSTRALGRLTSGAAAADRSETPRSGGPTLVLVEESPADEDAALTMDVLDLLDSDIIQGRTLRRARLQRRKRRRTQLSGQDDDGNPTVNDRTCCYLLAQELNRMLGTIAPGDLFKCRTCSSVYRIDNLVREERRHGQ